MKNQAVKVALVMLMGLAACLALPSYENDENRNIHPATVSDEQHAKDVASNQFVYYLGFAIIPIAILVAVIIFGICKIERTERWSYTILVCKKLITIKNKLESSNKIYHVNLNLTNISNKPLFIWWLSTMHVKYKLPLKDFQWNCMTQLWSRSSHELGCVYVFVQSFFTCI